MASCREVTDGSSVTSAAGLRSGAINASVLSRITGGGRQPDVIGLLRYRGISPLSIRNVAVAIVAKRLTDRGQDRPRPGRHRNVLKADHAHAVKRRRKPRSTRASQFPVTESSRRADKQPYWGSM